MTDTALYQPPIDGASPLTARKLSFSRLLQQYEQQTAPRPAPTGHQRRARPQLSVDVELSNRYNANPSTGQGGHLPRPAHLASGQHGNHSHSHSGPNTRRSERKRKPASAAELTAKRIQYHESLYDQYATKPYETNDDHDDDDDDDDGDDDGHEDNGGNSNDVALAVGGPAPVSMVQRLAQGRNASLRKDRSTSTRQRAATLAQGSVIRRQGAPAPRRYATLRGMKSLEAAQHYVQSEMERKTIDAEEAERMRVKKERAAERMRMKRNGVDAHVLKLISGRARANSDSDSDEEEVNRWRNAYDGYPHDPASTGLSDASDDERMSHGSHSDSSDDDVDDDDDDGDDHDQNVSKEVPVLSSIHIPPPQLQQKPSDTYHPEYSHHTDNDDDDAGDESDGDHTHLTGRARVEKELGKNATSNAPTVGKRPLQTYNPSGHARQPRQQAQNQSMRKGQQSVASLLKRFDQSGATTTIGQEAVHPKDCPNPIVAMPQSLPVYRPGPVIDDNARLPAQPASVQSSQSSGSNSTNKRLSDIIGKTSPISTPPSSAYMSPRDCDLDSVSRYSSSPPRQHSLAAKIAAATSMLNHSDRDSDDGYDEIDDVASQATERSQLRDERRANVESKVSPSRRHSDTSSSRAETPRSEQYRSPSNQRQRHSYYASSLHDMVNSSGPSSPSLRERESSCTGSSESDTDSDVVQIKEGEHTPSFNSKYFTFNPDDDSNRRRRRHHRHRRERDDNRPAPTATSSRHQQQQQPAVYDPSAASVVRGWYHPDGRPYTAVEIAREKDQTMRQRLNSARKRGAIGNPGDMPFTERHLLPQHQRQPQQQKQSSSLLLSEGQAPPTLRRGESLLDGICVDAGQNAILSTLRHENAVTLRRTGRTSGETPSTHHMISAPSSKKSVYKSREQHASHGTSMPSFTPFVAPKQSRQPPPFLPDAASTTITGASRQGTPTDGGAHTLRKASIRGGKRAPPIYSDAMRTGSRRTSNLDSVEHHHHQQQQQQQQQHATGSNVRSINDAKNTATRQQPSDGGSENGGVKGSMVANVRVTARPSLRRRNTGAAIQERIRQLAKQTGDPQASALMFTKKKSTSVPAIRSNSFAFNAQFASPRSAQPSSQHHSHQQQEQQKQQQHNNLNDGRPASLGSTADLHPRPVLERRDSSTLTARPRLYTARSKETATVHHYGKRASNASEGNVSTGTDATPRNAASMLLARLQAQKRAASPSTSSEKEVSDVDSDLSVVQYSQHDLRRPRIKTVLGIDDSSSSSDTAPSMGSEKPHAEYPMYAGYRDESGNSVPLRKGPVDRVRAEGRLGTTSPQLSTSGGRDNTDETGASHLVKRNSSLELNSHFVRKHLRDPSLIEGQQHQPLAPRNESDDAFRDDDFRDDGSSNPVAVINRGQFARDDHYKTMPASATISHPSSPSPSTANSKSVTLPVYPAYRPELNAPAAYEHHRSKSLHAGLSGPALHASNLHQQEAGFGRRLTVSYPMYQASDDAAAPLSPSLPNEVRVEGVSRSVLDLGTPSSPRPPSSTASSSATVARRESRGRLNTLVKSMGGLLKGNRRKKSKEGSHSEQAARQDNTATTNAIGTSEGRKGDGSSMNQPAMLKSTQKSRSTPSMPMNFIKRVTRRRSAGAAGGRKRSGGVEGTFEEDDLVMPTTMTRKRGTAMAKRLSAVLEHEADASRGSGEVSELEQVFQARNRKKSFSSKLFKSFSKRKLFFGKAVAEEAKRPEISGPITNATLPKPSVSIKISDSADASKQHNLVDSSFGQTLPVYHMADSSDAGSEKGSQDHIAAKRQQQQQQQQETMRSAKGVALYDPERHASLSSPSSVTGYHQHGLPETAPTNPSPLRRDSLHTGGMSVQQRSASTHQVYNPQRSQQGAPVPPAQGQQRDYRARTESTASSASGSLVDPEEMLARQESLKRGLETRRSVGELKKRHIIFDADAEHEQHDRVKTILRKRLEAREPASSLRKKKILKFGEYNSVYETHSMDDYDRSNDKPWTNLSGREKHRIKEELNHYKYNEMEVHPHSEQFTRYHT